MFGITLGVILLISALSIVFMAVLWALSFWMLKGMLALGVAAICVALAGYLSYQVIGKWAKKDDSDLRSFQLVKEYYNYSNEKAKQVLGIFTSDVLDEIEQKLNKGGK